MTVIPAASPQTFNVSFLLEAIPGKQGSGEALRYTEVYDKIREARREDNEKLPQGVWKAELKKADWDEVDFLCQEALKTRSKDLQIAIWFMEARLHLESMAGLAEGLELILGLSRAYWDTLYPQGLELRAGLYEWINLRLTEEMQSIPISLPTLGPSLPYQLIDLNEANHYEISLKKANATGEVEAPEGKRISLSKISLSMNQTSTSFYQNLEKNCHSSLKLLADLENELYPHLGREAPSFSKIREKIESVQNLARHVLETRGEIQEGKGPSIAEIQFMRPKTSLIGSIENREQAYEILEEVAAYLEHIEPHSPTPYLINRAISWGKMNLSQVVSDVTRDGGNLSLLLDILGVKERAS